MKFMFYLYDNKSLAIATEVFKMGKFGFNT